MSHLHKKSPASAFAKTSRPSAFRLLSAVIYLLAAAVVTPQAYAAVTKITAGSDHSLYLTDDGTLWAMGSNSDGQLGDGAAYYQKTPVKIATGVIAVAAGNYHSLFVKSDGTLWAMGWNLNGQLGDGTTTSRTIPVRVATGVIAVAAGNNYSLFLKSDGTLWTMGRNDYGQLGDGTTADRSIPMQVATGVIAVAAENLHSLFVKNDGTLWAMGWNYNGQLGDGTTTNRSIPVQIATGVIAMAAGGFHSLFVKNNGTLWAMGNNGTGQLGDGTFTSRNIPVQIATGVIAVAAGNSHSVFVKSNGTLWAMGQNYDGQLGDGTTTSRIMPVQVATDVIVVAAGFDHSLFVKSDGTLWDMGWNNSGELGDGTTTSRSIPVCVAPGSAPAIVAQPASQTVNVGQNATFVITTNGIPPPLLQWQSSRDGNTWANLSYTGYYTGITTATLTVTATTTALNGIQYRCVATNQTGSVTSDAATLTVNYAPAITTQPKGQAVVAGGTATFTIAATGNPAPAAYQWQSAPPDSNAWTDIPGATSTTLTITNVALAMSGMQYRCVTTNSVGSTLSNAVTLTINYVPTITTQPVSQTVNAGQDVTFVVEADGVPAPSLLWQSSTDGNTWTNFSYISFFPGTTGLTGYTGVNTGTFTVTSPVGTLNGTQYRCVATNSVGSATSNAATLTVNYAPAFTTQPVSQAIVAGGNAFFTITATGNPAATYQWQSAPHDSSAWEDISGATSTKLAITNAMDGAQYRCIATNFVGSTPSNAATLTVLSDQATAAQYLKNQFEATGTATITVTGAVDLTLAGGATLTSAKTIVGADAASTITGGLTITTSASNTVILGVNFNGGALDIDGADDVTVTNCTFTDTPVSITGGADNTAFAWNKFTATAEGAADAANNGSAMRIDNAGATIGILLQDNLWADGLLSNMPAVTNARVLMFNNYFTAGDATENATATIAGAGAQILSQNNIYQGTHNPLLTQDGGLLCALGNFMTETTGTTAAGADTVFVPAYSYTMLPAGIDTPSAATLAELITTCAGNTDGKNSVAPSSLANAALRIAGQVDYPSSGDSLILGGGSISLGSSSSFIWINFGSVNTTFNPGATQSKPKPVVPSTTVRIGGNLTLTANATDDSAAWQWYHDNFPIADATAAAYTVVNATTADAGAYSVAMTSASGEIVTSGMFNVIVDASDATTSGGGSGGSQPNNNSGGGGGGGGAPSLWYAAAIACFAAQRLLKHNRQRA